MIKEKIYRNGCFNDTISSTILFIAAYLFVLYISLGSTAFIAFTNHLTIPIEVDKIDFDRASSADKVIWDSSENIFLIFSFSPLTILLMGLSALMLTHKFNNKSIGVFLFWIMFHCIIRFFGEYIFGQIYNLWGVNLITDFMGLTAQNIYLKLLFITMGIVATLFLSLYLSTKINVFFNPFRHNTREGVKINLIYPAIFGSIVLIIWFIPTFSLKEISMILFTLINVVILSNYTINKYRLIEYTSEFVENDRFNIRLHFVPIIILIVLFTLLRIFLSKGLIITSSAFRRDQLDNIFYITILLTLLVSLLLFVGYVIYSIIKKKREFQKYMEENKTNVVEQTMDASFLEGTRWDYQADLSDKADKYTNGE